MGWGGILAAMAQGLGGGMIKNVENGWKEDAAQKEMDWRSKEYQLGREHESREAELDRKHEFDIINAKEQSAIRTAAAEAGIRARYARSGGDGSGGSGEPDYKKIFNDFTLAISHLESNKARLLDQIAQTIEAGGDTTDLNRQLELTENELNTKKNSEEYYRAAQKGGEAPKALYVSTTGRTAPITSQGARNKNALNALSTAQETVFGSFSPRSEMSGKPTVPEPTTRVITPAEKATYDAYVKAGKEREALQNRIEEAKRQRHSPDTESGYIYQKYWSK